MTQQANPLRQFFRQPAIYIRLPSDGQYWSEDSLDMPQNRELAVYPMTAVDEITYRTPDALFNGQAVVDVIQSCVPAVRNAWHMPSMDVMSVLIAMRIASYGHSMNLNSTCPKCADNSDFDLDLRSLLDRVGKPDYTKSLKQGDLEVIFRPLTFEAQNKNNIEQFENQRLIQSIPQSDMSEEQKVQQMTQVVKRITEITIKIMARSIAGIRTPQSLVTETNFIEEFLINCDRTVFEAVKAQAISLREQSEIKPVLLTCAKCEHQYEQPVNLDMSDFFA